MTAAFAVILLSRAERQLDEMYRYISRHGSAKRAEHFVDGVLEACSALRTFPERGTRRDDIRPGLRTVGYRRRVTVVFQVDETRHAVVVHGIFYGGQDFEAALRDED